MYARAVVRRIIEATRQLAHFPDSGRVVPGPKDPAFREIFVYSYRVLYRIREADDILIVNVIHGKRFIDL